MRGPENHGGDSRRYWVVCGWRSAFVHRRRCKSLQKASGLWIAASTVLDGKGKVLRDVRIVVEGAKIAAVETKADAKAGPADYDLRGLTVLPGWIDAHAHITPGTLAKTERTQAWEGLRRRMRINRRRMHG